MAEQLSNVYLAFWNLACKEPVSVATVRQRLVENRLNAERASDVPASTAFRRAADSLRSKETEAKTYTSLTTNRLRAQVDALTEEEGRLRRSFVGQYELSEDDIPVHVAGRELSEFVPAFEQASTHYTGADISKVIQAILEKDGLGAYSPRKGGGVYFVPVRPDAADLLTRIAAFAASVDVRFLTYSIPDNAAQRAEIADAIASTFADEIRVHAEAINAYDHETKAGTATNRDEAITATLTHMANLQHLMNGRYAQLVTDAETLKIRLGEVRVRIDAHIAAQNAQRRVSGQRRIVTAASV